MSFEDQLLNTLDEILGELRDINTKLDRVPDTVYTVVNTGDPDKLEKAFDGIRASRRQL